MARYQPDAGWRTIESLRGISNTIGNVTARRKQRQMQQRQFDDQQRQFDKKWTQQQKQNEMVAATAHNYWDEAQAIKELYGKPQNGQQAAELQALGPYIDAINAAHKAGNYEKVIELGDKLVEERANIGTEKFKEKAAGTALSTVGKIDAYLITQQAELDGMDKDTPEYTARKKEFDNLSSARYRALRQAKEIETYYSRLNTPAKAVLSKYNDVSEWIKNNPGKEIPFSMKLNKFEAREVHRHFMDPENPMSVIKMTTLGEGFKAGKSRATELTGQQTQMEQQMINDINSVTAGGYAAGSLGGDVSSPSGGSNSGSDKDPADKDPADKDVSEMTMQDVIDFINE